MPLNLIFTTPGDYTIADNGIAGDNTSVILDGTGTVIFTFAHPVDSLGFTTSADVNLVIDITDSLGAADLTVGTLGNLAASPDSIVVKNIHTSGAVVLVAEDRIREGGSDIGVDIVAGSIVFSAGTGVGTAGNAIETQTTAMEAETGTGGINIVNTGTLVIGGLTADVAGLDVATSGDISVTTLGSIFFTDADSFASVHGGSTSGNVTLVANGYDSDIGSLVDQDAITASGGSISLSAGRDIFFGTFGASYDNDVRARGSLSLTAGRDILIDGFADMASDDFAANTGGGIVAVAGRNISFPGGTGTDGGMAAGGSAGADVVLVTGAGGVLNLNAGNLSALSSLTGDVIVNADRITIGAGSGITANSGTVTLQTVTAGREIVLGSATEPGVSLNLSDAELDSITTNDLVIGNTSAGRISVVGAISPLNAPSLTLLSGGDVSLQASVTMTQALSILAGDNLIHTAGAVSATTFTAEVDDAGNDEEVGGFAALGSVTAGTIALSGGARADTLSGAQGVDQEVRGLGGNDVITSSGEGHYFGGSGNDTIFGGLSSGLPEVLDGGSGTDTLDTTSYSGSYTINMATGVTNFDYESFVNFEKITTGGGNDEITGTSGANTIRTGAGADLLKGVGGDDTLIGETGNDTLNGGSGNDSLNGGEGDDSMNGGKGDDTYVVDAAGDVVTEAADGGDDTVRTSITRTIDDEVETMELIGAGDIDGTGDARANTLTGNGGSNVLRGLGGNDTLTGGGGADQLLGGSGNDTLVWGAGDTELDGGSGTDTLKLSVDLDLTALANSIFVNIEQIDMTAGGGDTLRLVKGDVLAMSPTDTLTVLGDASDTLELASAFNDMGVTGGFREYRNGDATLLVDTDITVFFV